MFVKILKKDLSTVQLQHQVLSNDVVVDADDDDDKDDVVALKDKI